MTNIDILLTDHLDIWTSAIARKSTAGRGRSKKFSLHGIDKLRALILDLAVRGKLVPRDPNDEPASVALERAGNLRLSEFKLSQTRQVRGNVKTGNESPASLPIGWASAAISQIATIQAGFAFKSKDFNALGFGLPLIRIRDVGQTFTGTYYSGEFRDEFVVFEGDYLISMDGEFRVSTWKGPLALLNQRVARLIFRHEEIEQPFVAIALQIELSKLQGIKAYTTVDHLSGKQIAEVQIGLPPIGEQRRIVAKVDELMALCDRLEAGTYEAIEAHQLLVGELLATLTASRDADELADNWARIETHFDTLFVTEDSVEQLKQTILQLAVMGRLVPQDPKDEPALELLKRIKAAKIAAHEQEKLCVRSLPQKKGSKGLTFKTPTSWVTTSFDDVFLIASGVTKGQKIPPCDTVELPYLRVANVQRGFLDLSEIKSISVKSSDARRYKLRRGDILMTEGGDWDKVGRAAIWSDEIERCIHQNHVFRIRPPSDEIQPEWVINFVNSARGREYFQDASKQTTNLASINMTQLRCCPLPVPPLAEQHRILAKLKELFELCECLKSRLIDASLGNVEIADVVAAKAVG